MAKNKTIRQRLRDATDVCYECGKKYGQMSDGYVCTWRKAVCSICNEYKECTAPRDFRNFRKTLNTISS